MIEIKEEEMDELNKHYTKLMAIQNPIERMDCQIEYLKTQPLLTGDAILFLSLELKLLWDLHKNLFEMKVEDE